MAINQYRIRNQMAFMLADCAFILSAWVISIWFYSYLFVSYPPLLSFIRQGMLWMCLINMGIYWVFGLYKNIWRFASIGSLIRIALASMLSNFIIYVYFRAVAGYWQSPALPVLAFYLSLSLSGGLRFIPRVKRYLDYHRHKKQNREMQVPTLLVGAGQSASILLNDIGGSYGNPKYNILAIVDDNPEKQGLRIHGVDIIGNIEMIPEIVSNMGIQQILLAIPSATNEQMNRIVSYCTKTKCKISLIPSINESLQGVKGIRELNTSDLLERAETRLDTNSIKEMIEGKTVMVTGGGGSIGSELSRQLLLFDIERIVIVDIYENNAYDLFQELKISFPEKIERVVLRIGSVQDEDRMRNIFGEFRPSVVFHAAAYKHVPLLEAYPQLAVQNNVFGTITTARLADEFNVEKFVFISTDKAVNPTNMMGSSKRICEKVMISFNSLSKTEYACVRFGNVLGSNGSVVPIFERQIEKGGPVTVTHPEVTRYFMTIPEAARLVIQAAAIANGGEIFMLDMGEPVKIVNLAENMIRLAGYVPNVDIKIEFTGLRPGEKLYEELMTEQEGLVRTGKEKIFITTPKFKENEDYHTIMNKLLDDMDDVGRLKETIKHFVPEYRKPDHDHG